MTVTVIALLTINDEAPLALAKYFETTGPLLETAGAKITQRFEMSEAVAGNSPATSVVIVEYPNMDAVNSVFQSDEYKSIIPDRDKAFTTYQVNIVGN